MKYIGMKEYEKYCFLVEENNVLHVCEEEREYNCNNYVNNLHDKLFRDYNEHSAYLYDLMDKHGYCNHIISFDKYYDMDNKCDTLYVTFSESYNAVGNCSLERLKKYKEEYAKKCLDFWHFIKLFDYSEHPNDIDINEYYKRKETIDKVYDNTIWQTERINLMNKMENKLETKPTKIYRWNPIIKNIEEVKEKIVSVFKKS